MKLDVLFAWLYKEGRCPRFCKERRLSIQESEHALGIQYRQTVTYREQYEYNHLFAKENKDALYPFVDKT